MKPLDPSKPCRTCKHADVVPKIHPIRCMAIGRSYTATMMRMESGRCGPEGRLWEQFDPIKEIFG